MVGSLLKIVLSRPFVIVCRLILAAVFIYAAIGKIQDPERFAQSIAAYRILPISLVNLLAIVLPWVEILAALSLMSGILLRSGALLVMAMNAVFIVAAISALARGLDIECGCRTLSKASSKVGLELIARDLGYMLLCLPIMWRKSGEVKGDR